MQMELKMKIILLYARGYSISENGKTNEGITVQYLINDNLDPTFTQDDRGFRATKGSLPLSEWPNISDCPALYDGVFGMKTGSDGKAQLKLKTCQFISHLETKQKKYTPASATA